MHDTKDISSRKDVAFLVESFYKKLVDDSEIGFFFTEVIPVDFELHLPKMINFWETLLFGAQAYKGNPMIKHFKIDQLEKIEDKHFAEWLRIWSETVRSLFFGEIADKAIDKATSISELMKFKVSQNRQFYPMDN